MKREFTHESFRAPRALRVTETEFRRGLFVGSCFAESLGHHCQHVSGTPHDYAMYHSKADLDALTTRPISDYDYVGISIALRFLVPEDAYNRIALDDEAAFEAMFRAAVQRLTLSVEDLLAYLSERNVPTFVCDFLAPQQNLEGRLFRRRSYSNFAYFVARLNEELEDLVNKFRYCYLLSLDEIAATLGKMHLQDEVVFLSSHGTLMTDWGHAYDQSRLEPMAPLSAHYELRLGEFFQAVWNEIDASIRTLRQQDAVKLALVDLDDTLWRGVVGEGQLSPVPVEGWPLGFAEALTYLRRRGVILGIVSKNDEALVAKKWPEIYSNILKLEDFAIRKINWEPKAANIERILAEVNLLPRNVLFVDDNPIEREAVKEAFPEIRVLGAHPQYLKQILMYAPETQVPVITAESAKRNEMVQGQVLREQARQKLSRAEFLVSLEVGVRAFVVDGLEHEKFPRCFELLNKTNQFNTTGRRWSMDEIAAYFADGGKIWAFEASDRFTRYGLIALGMTRGAELTQMVMSCRVVGMEIEIAALSVLERELSTSGASVISAKFQETASNNLCRDLFPKNGYHKTEAGYRTDAGIGAVCPPHIRLEIV